MKFNIHLLIIIGILIFGEQGIAQVNKLDSLERILNDQQISDSLRLKTLLDLGWAYHQKDSRKSTDFTMQCLVLSQKVNNKIKSGEAYNLLAVNYGIQNYPLDTVVATYQKSLVLAKETNQMALQANVLNNMGLAYKKAGQTDIALASLQKGLKIAEKNNYKATIVRCLNSLAILYKDENELEIAKAYYQRGLKYSEEINNRRFIAYLSNNLAIIYDIQNQRDSALILYNKSLNMKRELNDNYSAALTLANIGSIYTEQEKYERASDLLQESYQLASETDNIHGKGLSLSLLSLNFFQQKKYDNAINIAKEALKILGENGDMMLRMDCYEYLYNSYEAKQNYKLAFETQKLYHVFADSLYNVQKNKQINDLKIQYEVEQKNTENELLKSKTENAQETIRIQTFAAIGLILALIFAIGWGLFTYRANQEKKQLNEVLENKVNERTAELQKANKELEQANYELRTFNYIASHDIKEPIRIIGGYASLAFKKLPQNLKENLGEYFDTIKRSTTQLYTLIEDFTRYTAMSKNDTIEKEAVDLNQLTDTVIDNLQESIQKYKGQVLKNDLPVIESCNSLLFAALKNLIENGLKYNHSDHPTVEIEYKAQQAHHQIIVSDNGVGIDKQFQAQIFEMFKRLHSRGVYEGSGIGLAIVKLSVDKLEGNIELKSDKGQGSKFIISLPK